jgi:hypothetical protein
VPIVKIRYTGLPVVNPIWNRQANKGYGINCSAYRQVAICNLKQGHYSEVNFAK